MLLTQLITWVCKNSLTLTYPPNAHVVKHRMNWGRRALTTYATAGKKYQCVILETHVYHVSICKVDYMMVNTFNYAIITLNYNEVMRILPKSYRVATIVEH